MGDEPAREPDAEDRLLRLLDLQPAGEDVFLAPTPAADQGPPRLFGGQVASQALRAATLTVPTDRPPHSLHAYFVRPGRPGVPLFMHVERTRDGGSFTTRHVTGRQGDDAIFTMIASFQGDEPGYDWPAAEPLEVPLPEDLPDPPPSPFSGFMPFEMKPTRGLRSEFPMAHPFWVRTRSAMPDDRQLHACLMAFVSDMAVVEGARAPGSTAPMFSGASLDHALWFLRPARLDDWLLFSVDPVSNAGGRGLATGRFRTRDGVLVGAIAQEALLRPARQG